MAQKYQNEISPIFYYGNSPKTNEKDLTLPNLQPPDWGQPYRMTRYIRDCATIICNPFLGHFSLGTPHFLLHNFLANHWVCFEDYVILEQVNNNFFLCEAAL